MISIGTEKSFNKKKYFFMIKVLRKLIEAMYLNIIKATYEKSIANVILNWEKLKPFPLKSETR
jgi:hypothetical protein